MEDKPPDPWSDLERYYQEIGRYISVAGSIEDNILRFTLRRGAASQSRSLANKSFDERIQLFKLSLPPSFLDAVPVIERLNEVRDMRNALAHCSVADDPGRPSRMGPYWVLVAPGRLAARVEGWRLPEIVMANYRLRVITYAVDAVRWGRAHGIGWDEPWGLADVFLAQAGGSGSNMMQVEEFLELALTMFPRPMGI